MLRREGWQINHKRVHRSYRPDGLKLRMRVRRRMHMGLSRGVVPKAERRNQLLSTDFVEGRLFDERPVSDSHRYRSMES
jgi:putative transposase